MKFPTWAAAMDHALTASRWTGNHVYVFRIPEPEGGYSWRWGLHRNLYRAPRITSPPPDSLPADTKGEA